MAALQYDVFVTPAIPQSSDTVNLPNGDPLELSPVATTLIYGEHDAVLIELGRYPLAGESKSGLPHCLGVGRCRGLRRSRCAPALAGRPWV